ncbi:hypothetical protein B0T19DRAFT_446619 [Cercophora scortea]|uniref:WSC domain-containing protein n=1 Tax=Cercophora scortea TaxID=314031 RepID=A0AAE0I3B5_9PEZI|nr:hypothetical protein B0T19DRAFT_446619 [Cercophora scortea]
MKSIAFVAAALLAVADMTSSATTKVVAAEADLASSTNAAKGVEQPATAPKPSAVSTHGCYKSSGELVLNTTLTYNTDAECAQNLCWKKLNLPVGGTSNGDQCWCGEKYPPKSDLVDDKYCNIGCSGYDLFACGGFDGETVYWTIYNSGMSLIVKTSEDTNKSASESGSSSSTTSSPTATSTESSGETIIVTQSAVATNVTPAAKSTNTAGIAAGVVVGVVVLAALVGGAWFYIRRRRNKDIEEEHRRNAAVNAFTGKPPGSSGGMSILDARLDPVMAQRRMSDGSIADNQDYSRRILRVTNA